MALKDKLANEEETQGYGSLDALNKAWNLNKNNYGTDAKGNNDYWKAYQTAITDYGTKNASNKEFDSTTYNLYKNYVDQNATAAKDQYDAFILNQNNALNSKLEQNNIKDNAMKYAAQQMNASGLGSQGIAQSYQSAIGNNYASNMASIDTSKAENDTSVANAYSQAVLENQNTLNSGLIDKATTDKSNAYEMAISMLQNADSSDDVSKIKDMYYNGLSSEQQKAFDYYASDIENADTFTGTTYSSIDELRNAASTTGKDSTNVGEDFNYETQTLSKVAAQGKLNYGDTILLKNGDNKDSILVKYTQNGYQIIGSYENGKEPTDYTHKIEYNKDKSSKTTFE